MRRPRLTVEQRRHQRQQRALLGVRRACVRWSDAVDAGIDDTNLALADLLAAAARYTQTLTPRERRKEGKR